MHAGRHLAPAVADDQRSAALDSELLQQIPYHLVLGHLPVPARAAHGLYQLPGPDFHADGEDLLHHPGRGIFGRDHGARHEVVACAPDAQAFQEVERPGNTPSLGIFPGACEVAVA